MKFQVHYSKDPSQFIFTRTCPDFVSIETLSATHTHLKDIEAESLEDVFHQMQGEVWSPNGEARSLILEKGLHHTSMSSGDIVIDETGMASICCSIGWEEVPKTLPVTSKKSLKSR